MKTVIREPGCRPVKIWTNDIEPEALAQLKNLSHLPFIAPNGVAAMPDVHAGKGSTIGTVIATDRAVIPAAVGVDIGCGMNAVRLSLKATDLPHSLTAIRHEIERQVPLGPGGRYQHGHDLARSAAQLPPLHDPLTRQAVAQAIGSFSQAEQKAVSQLGTLGSGNHFIELCLDENQDVWIMLHSGSRGIGNMIGMHYIALAKRDMERQHIHLPDGDLAYLTEGSQHFSDYMAAVEWAQAYALANRRLMMELIVAALRTHIPRHFTITQEAINCHHNYVTREQHFGKSLWVARKGAIRAREGDLGIIPGSMGQQSYIVRGKGNLEAYCSCAHGAGRQMSRTKARKMFTIADLRTQTAGVECRKDEAVLDEIPGAYKNIDQVMENQRDLVEVVHTLKQVLCVKGA